MSSSPSLSSDEEDYSYSLSSSGEYDYEEEEEDMSNIVRPQYVEHLHEYRPDVRVRRTRVTATIHIDKSAVQSGKIEASVALDIVPQHTLSHNCILVSAQVVGIHALRMPVDTLWTLHGAPRRFVARARTSNIIGLHASQQLVNTLIFYPSPDDFVFCSTDAYGFDVQECQRVIRRVHETLYCVPITYKYATLLARVCTAQAQTRVHPITLISAMGTGYAPLRGSHDYLYDSLERLQEAIDYVASMQESLVPALQSESVKCVPLEPGAWSRESPESQFEISLDYILWYAQLTA